MTGPHSGFLAALERAAVAAQQEELRFRANVASEIARRERERQFAFRRVEIAKAMARAAATADAKDDAVAAQAAAFRRELGWYGETEHKKATLEQWRKVAEAVWRDMKPDDVTARDGVSVPEAMAQFEAWYVAQFGENYLALLDREMPEIPVVEF